MNLIKIDNDFFYVDGISYQFSVGSHAVINLTINTYKYPQYYTYFTDIFDSYSQIKSKNEMVFNLKYKNYDAKGCLIKSLDIDSMNYLLYVNINCDYLEEKSIQEKRDELLDDVLKDETSEK